MSEMEAADSSQINLQALVDRLAIQDVLVGYFRSADSGDQSLMRRCFTHDVRAHYANRPPVSGLDALMDQIPLFRNLASGACTICTHFMGNLRFCHLDVASAETETHVFAFLVVPQGNENLVNMRSLRSFDRWRRETGGWKIAERKYTLDWSCQVPATFASAFSERVHGLPEAPHGS